jgi:uncharacterized membrane protein
MSKERLVAFTDAVIAIIITILILELEKPTSLTWGAVWDLRMNLFAYTITFNNSVAQALYGIVVLLVSLTNVWMYQELAAVAEDSVAKTLARGHNRIMVLDIVLKLLGLVLTLTVFPSAMMWSVLITALVLIIPRSL